MTAPRVAIVSLGRDVAKGEVRRVASWRTVFERAGATVEEIRLSPGRIPHLDGLGEVMRGNAAPERLAWSGRRLRSRVEVFAPSLVVVVSARAFEPALTDGPWAVIVDLVDSLSRSYRDRADLVSGLARRIGYRALATAHARVERRVSTAPSLRIVAAGWADAHELGAEWTPIVTDPALAPVAGATPDHDVLFFGTLRYPPNVDALERLSQIWPYVLRSRPGTTALIAGSAPTDRVRQLCHTQGWSLLPDFPSLPELAARARVAVAPLVRTAGMQIKILDAATIGLPQVVRSPALAGFDPDFPLKPFDHDADFAAEAIRLLDDPSAATVETERAHDHAVAMYSAEHWTDWARAATGY